MTFAGTGLAHRVEEGFRARVFLWTGSGLLVSLSVALLVARNGLLSDLMWGRSPLVPLAAAVAQIAIVVALCVWWKVIPFRAARSLSVVAAVLLGTMLSAGAGGPRAFVVQALVASSCAFVGAGLVGLAAGIERGWLPPVLAMAAVGGLAAASIHIAWTHSTLPYFVVAGTALVTAYDLRWARRIDRLAADGTDWPAVWGAIALLVGLVELLLMLLSAFGRGLGSLPIVGSL